MIVATNILEHDYNLKLSVRPAPSFAGDAKSFERIRTLDFSGVDFRVHFGIMAGGDEDVIEVT